MFMRLALAAILAGTLHSITLAGQDVSLDQLPPAVVESIRERFNQPEWLAAKRTMVDGRPIKFEVEIRSDGKKFEIDVTPKGLVMEVRLTGN